MRLIGAIDIKLSLGEQVRHWAECMPKNIKAYDVLMRGNECRHRQNRKDNLQSRIYYNESIGIEPTAAMPHIMKGFSHVWEATMQFKYKSEQKKIAEALRKAGLPDGLPVPSRISDPVH